MPPKSPPIADRIQRLEDKLAALAEETQELRVFCLDIHPLTSKRIIKTMEEMEQKVFLNVTAFEKQVGEINHTVKTLVAKSASNCLELVQSAIGTKMAGLDSRMIGLNKRHVEIDKELTQTLKRLNEFSDSVEKTLEDANMQALKQLNAELQETVSNTLKIELINSPLLRAHLQETVSTMLRTELLHSSLLRPPSTHHSSSSVSDAQLHSNLSAPSSISSITPLPRGRSREKFTLLQNHLILRARSVSSECELRGLIKDARSAAVARVDEC